MNKKIIIIFLISIGPFLSGPFAASTSDNYPSHWWKKISESERQGSWEILPHEAKKGELILSKRNELGVFSNLAHTPFVLSGVRYASIEALWQMMKYPDATDKNDARNNISYYPHTREAIYSMHGFESKRSGSAANKINKKYGFAWISYQHKKFNYKDMKAGSVFHYEIISAAIFEKVRQNPNILKLLLRTKGLVLMPDHKQGQNKPKSYFYHKILMDIRDKY